MKTSKVSIIIPVKEINDYIKESLSYINSIDFKRKDLEVIILPDKKDKSVKKHAFKIKIIPTGHIFPGAKRDIGLKHAAGRIIAFIDDDVFPGKTWLKRAIEIFNEDKNIASVCGPAVTPESDSFLQKVSGFIYSSFLGGGGYRYRYMPEKRRDVDDYPSSNLIIRRDILNKIGGFNTAFWPGEDTVICLKIVKDLKMRIVYDPGVIVFHHRRNFFTGHINQVKNYATHRGYFVKRFPETSFRLSYFIPTFFVIYLLSFVFSFFVNCGKILCFLWLAPAMIYLVLLLIDGIRVKNIKYSAHVILGILLTHVYYGIYFIKGLFSKKLKDEQTHSCPK